MLKATSSNVNVSQITGVLPVVNGGTGVTTSTGTGNVVLSAAPTLSGNVTLSTGNLIVASGQGIDFSATPGAGTSELLADYEEGTFTPIVLGDATAGTATYGAANGSYTKVGRLVSFQIYISWSSGTGTGNLEIGGLPFTNANNSTYPAISIGYINDITLTANTAPLALLFNNATKLYFYQVPSGGGANVQIPYDSAGSLIIAGTYPAA